MIIVEAIVLLLFASTKTTIFFVLRIKMHVLHYVLPLHAVVVNFI